MQQCLLKTINLFSCHLTLPIKIYNLYWVSLVVINNKILYNHPYWLKLFISPYNYILDKISELKFIFYHKFCSSSHTWQYWCPTPSDPPLLPIPLINIHYSHSQVNDPRLTKPLISKICQVTIKVRIPTSFMHTPLYTHFWLPKLGQCWFTWKCELSFSLQRPCAIHSFSTNINGDHY